MFRLWGLNASSNIWHSSSKGSSGIVKMNPALDENPSKMCGGGDKRQSLHHSAALGSYHFTASETGVAVSQMYEICVNPNLFISIIIVVVQESSVVSVKCVW
jgi:hypothetical protein